MPTTKTAPSRAETRKKNRRRALLREAAQAREERSARIFDWLVRGLPHDAIAREENCSVHNVRKIVARQLAARRIEPVGDFAKLQVARLNDALAAVHCKMLDGDIACVDRLLKVVAELDRYHGLARVSELSAGLGSALVAPRRAAPAALPAPERHAEETEVRQICIPSL